MGGKVNNFKINFFKRG